MNPLVSIIITNFNKEKYLEQCLKSCFNQTYKNFEICIADNNSTDRSIKIISKYKKKVRIFNVERKYKTGKISDKIKIGWHIPHPGTIINKNLIKDMDYFDTNYKIAADFDFFFRCLLNKSVSYFYYDKFTVLMLPGGQSSGFKNVIKSNIECYDSLKKHHYAKPLLFVIFKIIRKVLQFS